MGMTEREKRNEREKEREESEREKKKKNRKEIYFFISKITYNNEMKCPHYQQHGG